VSVDQAVNHIQYVRYFISVQAPKAEPPSSPPTRSQDADRFLKWFLAVLFVLMVVYLWVPEIVVSVLAAGAGLGAGVVGAWAGGLHRRGAFYGASWLNIQIWALLPYLGGLISVGLLVTAPFESEATRYFDAFEAAGLPELIEIGGRRAVFFAAYQALGIVLIVGAVSLPLLTLTALQADVNLQNDAGARRAWTQLVRVTARWGTRPRVTLAVATVVAVFACALTSGLPVRFDALAGHGADGIFGEAPALTQARATASGAFIVLTYRLTADATVAVEVLAPGQRQNPLRALRLDAKSGLNRHRFRAVSEGRPPRRLAVRLVAEGPLGRTSAPVNLRVQRQP
jgi:hypothetical protein